jgi:hypothetical protein
MCTINQICNSLNNFFAQNNTYSVLFEFRKIQYCRDNRNYQTYNAAYNITCKFLRKSRQNRKYTDDIREFFARSRSFLCCRLYAH